MASPADRFRGAGGAGDVYEVRAMAEVQAARSAAARCTDADATALRSALEARRATADGPDNAAFVDANVTLHAAVVDAAHNPALTDPFTEFAPALCQGLIGLVDLRGLHDKGPQRGDAHHAGLVDAAIRGDADGASRTLQVELDAMLAQLLDR
ncbi:FadR/GntR family transcriptional regulator [Streptomyces pinistramenti]|uniref:FadR/GntR family transcriptional regulator n=1 Tax=Streptomyces pinistramenti TaxID=2884812 RepID=UPI001D074F58|nr:FCD domain-containing protein [Streptomyces pinistramenti]MCB5908967.1 FCD domain-containing protein [Streptomyces pinistramenti]